MCERCPLCGDSSKLSIGFSCSNFNIFVCGSCSAQIKTVWEGSDLVPGVFAFKNDDSSRPSIEIFKMVEQLEVRCLDPETTEAPE